MEATWASVLEQPGPSARQRREGIFAATAQDENARGKLAAALGRILGLEPGRLSLTDPPNIRMWFEEKPLNDPGKGIGCPQSSKRRS